MTTTWPKIQIEDLPPFPGDVVVLSIELKQDYDSFQTFVATVVTHAKDGVTIAKIDYINGDPTFFGFNDWRWHAAEGIDLSFKQLRALKEATFEQD